MRREHGCACNPSFWKDIRLLEVFAEPGVRQGVDGCHVHRLRLALICIHGDGEFEIEE